MGQIPKENIVLIETIEDAKNYTDRFINYMKYARTARGPNAATCLFKSDTKHKLKTYDPDYWTIKIITLTLIIFIMLTLILTRKQPPEYKVT